MRTNNSNVVSIIARGGIAENHTSSFWGADAAHESIFSARRGYLPEKVARALDEAANQLGGYQAVIFSYATPIALKIAGVWLRPDVTYSMTTSSKHQSQLWQLGAKWLPADATAQDVRDVIAGYVEYDPADGKMHRGPVVRPENKAVAA